MTDRSEIPPEILIKLEDWSDAIRQKLKDCPERVDEIAAEVETVERLVLQLKHQLTNFTGQA